jgi:hypothetical protein
MHYLYVASFLVNCILFLVVLVVESCVLVSLSPVFFLVCCLMYVELLCVVLFLFESFCSMYCSAVSDLARAETRSTMFHMKNNKIFCRLKL